MVLQCKLIKQPQVVSPIQTLNQQYEFPVFQELEAEDGKKVSVKVGQNRVTKEQLLQQKAAIDAMLIAIGVEEAKEVVKEQPVDAEIVEPKG